MRPLLLRAPGFLRRAAARNAQLRLHFLVVALACTAAIPAAHSQQLLFDYLGFDYEYPIVVAGTFGGIGNGYVGLGEVPVVAAPLVSDQTTYEYTYVLTGLTATARFVSGGFVVVDYTGPGTLTVYEDSRSTGTAFDYGVNPPNATAPPSFTDGAAILVGNITNFRYVVNLATGSGSYDADFDAVGGTQIGNLPLGQRKGWTFAGVTENTASIPTGYAHQVDGQTMIPEPTPARSASWGEIKRKYR
jgi:hypothetical protein